MLRRIGLKGFKAFEEGDVPLRPFTVLIGPNGAGKTTIMEALDLVGRLVTGSIKDLLDTKGWDYGDLPHLRAASRAFSIETEHVAGDRTLTWQLGLGARRRPGIASERIAVAGAAAQPPHVLLERHGRKMWREDSKGNAESIVQTLTSSWLSAVGPEDATRFPDLVWLATWARGIRGYFFLDPLRLRAPSRGLGTELGVNGESLAPFLARLRERDREAFVRVQDRVRKLYPRLRELHPVRRGYGWTHLEVTEGWNGEVARFNARQVSDGLLRLIAVAAMYELPSAPSVLLLDEIENGLHPHLLGGFVKMLQEMVRTSDGAVQVILTTHSPITLNSCQADDVLLVTRGNRGHPRCLPLSKTRGFEKLRGHFELGELWYNVGEPDLMR